MTNRSTPCVALSISWCALLAFATGCSAPGPAPDLPPTRAFEHGLVFPADRSLARPEDGVALPDGRLIVADQVHGLRLVARDGTSKPFGGLRGAGYANDPPRRAGAANGVSLEPDGAHLLVADVLAGGIYRVSIRSGATELVHQHPYGVNTACRDSSGAIWFTQSAKNTAEQGEAGMFAAVDLPIGSGALWRLPARDGRLAAKAELVLGDLHYPNGLVLDEERGRLYLSELGRDRVLGFRLDVENGRIDDESTVLSIPTPDNLEMDRHGRLWIASPVRSEVIVLDTLTGASHVLFRAQTAAQEALAAEFVRRGRNAKPRIELLTPALWEPLPGPVTGVILGTDDRTVHLAGLGNALLRLEL